MPKQSKRREEAQHAESSKKRRAPSGGEEKAASSSAAAASRRDALIDEWNRIQSVQDEWWAVASQRTEEAELDDEAKRKAGAALESEWSKYKDSYGNNGLAGGWGRTATAAPTPAVEEEAPRGSSRSPSPSPAPADSGSPPTPIVVEHPTSIAAWAP